MANPRLMIEAGLNKGAGHALEEPQARHVGTVLRLNVGDELRVFNARDGEWRARITTKSKRGMSVVVGDKLRDAHPSPDLDLLFAPVKRHATDLIVEKATELGVRRIRPVITQRTIAETVRLDRLRSIAREAAEQTERFDVPALLEPLALAKALDGWDASRPLIYADEAGDDAEAPWGGERGRAAPIVDALKKASPLAGEVSRERATEGGRTTVRDRASSDADAKASRPPPPAPAPPGGGGSLALLIGPEGGFAPEERRMLRGLSQVIPVSLGPRILRAETAVIAALSVIQAIWGDWHTP